MRFFRIAFVTVSAAVCLCQCAAPRPPVLRHVPFASRVPAADLISTIRADWSTLGNPSEKSAWPQARQRYNANLAKLLDQLVAKNGSWDNRAHALGTRIVTADPSSADPEKLDAMFPASLSPRRIVRATRRSPGLGIPLVGWKITAPVGTRRNPYELPNGIPYNLTAVLDFPPASPPVWRFIKRWTHDDTKIGRSTHPLAADWSAPASFFWHMCDLDNLLLQNVLLPGRFTEETGLYFLEPYDPEKIPLVLVHGLVSSPDAFKNIVNNLAPEPWIRQNYQIWLYNYPTGNPWPYSAMNFREKLREAIAYAHVRGGPAKLGRMVIVAHSMGGLVSRSSVTPPGTLLYDAHYQTPLGELKASEKTKRFIAGRYLYKPLTEPERVVFLAVPHRGSPWADFRLSLWLSRLIRLPKTLTIELVDQAVSTANTIGGKNSRQNPITSINTLSPENKDTRALARLPLPRKITFHSIIGDRGKGNTPDSSDGIVPYWSSHITPVASEKIVPADHRVPDAPETSEELKRILKLHLAR